MAGSRLGKAATAAAFVATEKPGAGEPAPRRTGPCGSGRGVDKGPEQSGGRRPPALLLRDAKAEGRRKRGGGGRCELGPFLAPVARSKKAGARPPPTTAGSPAQPRPPPLPS